jgi:hypothetical protein
MKQKDLPIVEIEATAGTQVRRFLDPKIIEAYTEDMQARAVFPPIIVFAEKGSKRYVLADGFHRLASAKAAGLTMILCDIREGRVHDALAFALGANVAHGLRRTNKDKRNAVEIALKDPEWSVWSAADISALCRVGADLVRKVREDLVLAGDIEDQETVKTRRGGKIVERKASSGTKVGSSYRKRDEGDSSSKSTTSNNRRSPRTQYEVDRDDFFDSINRINGYTYDGGFGADAWQAYDRVREVELAIEWMQQYIAGCKANKAA